MIDYNPKAWFTFIFRIHKADTVRKLFPMFIAIGFYAAAIALLELKVLHLSDVSEWKGIVFVHTLLGFVISLLLVFRTNTAYDRWWEGRRLWGSLVNNSRNLAIKLNAMLPASNTASRDFFRAMIPNYAFALKNHLRNQFKPEELDISLGGTMPDDKKHVPNQIASQLIAHVQDLYRKQQISGEQLITLNTELDSFTDIMGACERIRNTPIPFSYSAFIKKFIFFYVMTLPFGYVFTVGFLIVPIVIFVFYVLASLELIAEEIEDPFGFDANDLPTDTISANIRKHVAEIL